MSRRNFSKKHGRAVLAGQFWFNGLYEARVMAVAEGHVMMRRTGAAPFLRTVKDLDLWTLRSAAPSIVETTRGSG